MQCNSVSVSAAVDAYTESLRTMRNLSVHTLRAYRSDLDTFVAVAEGQPVSQITRVELEQYVACQIREGRSVATIRRRMSAVRGFLSWVARDSPGWADPAVEFRLELRPPLRLPRTIDKRQLRRLLELLSAEAGWALSEQAPRSANFDATTTLIATALMLETGVRVGELAALSLRDIDLSDGSIHVTGKGQRDRRVFYANPWLTEILDWYVAQRRTQTAVGGRFLLNRLSRPLSTDTIRRRLRRASERAGLHEAVTPHRLRHTAATLLVDSGVDIRVIQRMLGHASLSTTEIYAHVSEATLRSLVGQAMTLQSVIRD